MSKLDEIVDIGGAKPKEAIIADIKALFLELVEKVRDERYESHKNCDHPTDSTWGQAYNDATHDIEAEIKDL